MLKKKFYISVLITAFFIGSYYYLTTGSLDIPPYKIAVILYKKLFGLNLGQDKLYALVIWNGRLPRFIVSFLVGTSLAITGCVMQAIFKNPMASPGVTGVSSAAVFGAVLSLVIGVGYKNLIALPLFSILFSIITLLVVYLLSTSKGKTSIIMLLLVGMACSLFFASCVTLLITLKLNDWQVSKIIISWTFGELNDRQWTHIYIVFTTLIVGVSIVIFFVKDLNIIMHGEEFASNFGVDISKVRFFLLLACAVLTGGAVGVAGLIGFVGLIVPHISRTIIGNDNKILIPAAGLFGGVFLIYCDLLIRCIGKVDLKIGTVTGLLGAPYFISLLRKNRKRYLYF